MRPARFVALAVIVSLGTPAEAFVRPYAKQTLGSGKYYGATASVDAGGDLHFKPQFTTYQSSTSSGTFNTYSLRGMYDYDRYGVGVAVGMTPTVNAYNNRFVGGDFSVDYDFDPPQADTAPVHRRPVIRRLSLLGGVTQTYHRQIVTAPSTTAGNKTIPGTSDTKSIGQTDIEGSAALTLEDWVVSLDLTKSAYNVDLARLATRAAAVTRLAGLSSTIQGFPELNASLRVELDRWLVAPYVSYTYTHYKVTQPISVAYAFGARADWDTFYLDASYERFAQKGAADVNYYSLAAKLRFR